MTPASTFKGKRVALFGLGGSGLATAESLKAGGAQVIAWDDGEAARRKASDNGLFVSDLASADWTTFDALILAPGVPLTHPEPHWTVKQARAANIEIIGDIEIFARERAALAPDAPLVAITGTNGKSTTTALIAHLLTIAGRDVHMGGNIGIAALSLEPPGRNSFGESRVHVLEVSTFQIDLAPSLAPTIGLLLNITPDHIDRHGTFENYAAIKERLIDRSGTAVVAVDDDTTRGVVARMREKGKPVIEVSARLRLENGVYADGPTAIFARQGRILPVANIGGIGSLLGAHNAQNVAAAVACVSLLGVDAATIQMGLRSFPGLAHRMEEIGRLGRTLFINDSKATNAESTRWALEAFASGVFWILGGKPKEGGIASLKHLFPRVEKAYLIGAASDEFAATLSAAQVPFERSETLEHAVEHAAIDAVGAKAKQPVVLLSPACASYDQFPNFEVRGRRFRDLCLALPDFAPTPKELK
ncbi:MAG: UDP-N-acetylmuramoyl-L-alanine--D-glutamate ligase [Beijerinckiaceae bacterium]|nr:UDP-N-acetylmuramoyl-L-alanine--D-glutamate ligase [Beijerinckiaceae bacterium]